MGIHQEKLVDVYICIPPVDGLPQTPHGLQRLQELCSIIGWEIYGADELEQESMGHDAATKIRTTIRRAIAPQNTSGRKRKEIAFTEICNALRDTKGNYSKAARQLEARIGAGSVSPGLVHIRITREAQAKSLTHKELLSEILLSPRNTG
jgi:hypothetical protein